MRALSRRSRSARTLNHRRRRDATPGRRGQSPHALADFLFRNHAEAQPHGPTSQIAGVSRLVAVFARYVQNALVDARGKQRAVPTTEITSAIGYLDSMVSELKTNPSEQDAGWNLDMDALRDLTSNADNRTAKSLEPFTGGGQHPKGDTYDKGSLEGF